MARRRPRRKAKKTGWILPVCLCLAVTAAAAVVLLLVLGGKMKPMKTTAALPETVSAAAERTVMPETEPEDTEPGETEPEETEPEETAAPEETETETEPGKASRPKPTPTPSATPQPEAVDLDMPYYITINKGAQLVTVYTLDSEGEYTVPVRYMICSTGERDKTPSGLFRVKDKHRWQRMLASELTYAQYGSRITGSYLFHSVNFHDDKPNLLKVENYNNLGTVDSGGCVRLQVADAKWVYENVPTGTPVRIYIGVPQPDITLDLLPEQIPGNSKWDPSDPDEANPNPRDVPGFEILNTPYPGVTPAPLSETFSPDVARVTRTLPPE